MSEVTPEVLAEAKADGWAEKDQWRGPESAWVDADEFVRRKHTVLPLLRKENEKLQQTESMLLASSGLLQPGQTSLPMLLCGDLNSEPSSAVYKLLTNNVAHGRRRVDLTQADLPNDPCNILGQYLRGGRLGHGMLLASLYAQVAGAEPAFTNLTRDFTGTLGECCGARGGGSSAEGALRVARPGRRAGDRAERAERAERPQLRTHSLPHPCARIRAPRLTSHPLSSIPP